ncbi:MAG: hypothetical protein D6731_12595 [Planctomycetota bacterium]|nr:MAG: hypothetical protein D6731_12595 [Planctomycetota bacterium]
MRPLAEALARARARQREDPLGAGRLLRETLARLAALSPPEPRRTDAGATGMVSELTRNWTDYATDLAASPGGFALLARARPRDAKPSRGGALRKAQLYVYRLPPGRRNSGSLAPTLWARAPVADGALRAVSAGAEANGDLSFWVSTSTPAQGTPRSRVTRYSFSKGHLVSRHPLDETLADWVWDLAMAPDGRLFVLLDAEVRSYAPDGRLLQRLPLGEGRFWHRRETSALQGITFPRRLAVLPGERLFVAGPADGAKLGEDSWTGRVAAWIHGKLAGPPMTLEGNPCALSAYGPLLLAADHGLATESALHLFRGRVGQGARRVLSPDSARPPYYAVDLVAANGLCAVLDMPPKANTSEVGRGMATQLRRRVIVYRLLD